MACNANKTEICGGPNRLNIYNFNVTIPVATSSGTTVNTPTPTKPPTSTGTGSAVTSSTSAAATGFPSGWTSQGCWVDGPNGRIMPTYQDPDSQTLTQQSCAQLCFSKGYSVSGTEYSSQCFCSNAIYNGGAKASDQTKCNTACSGDKTQTCG